MIGISWDEPTHWEWGAAKLDFWIGFLSGERAWGDFGEATGSLVHPGLWDMSHAFLMRLVDGNPWDVGHYLSALFGISGLVAGWAMGRYLGGPGLGLAALVLLTLTPRYFGHLWFNPKDIPFAACSAWSLYFALRILRTRRSPEWGSLIAFGIVVGLSLGLRFAGFLVPFYLAVALFGSRIFDPEGEPGFLKWSGLWAVRGLAVLSLALIVAFPFWPALWVTPAASVAEGANYVQSFDWDFPVLFNGAFINASELPWFYLPLWVAITLPLPHLIFLGIALFRLLGKIGRAGKGLSPEWILVGLAAVFPLAYVVGTDPIIYDGMRHFLFVLPPLAVLAAGGWGVLGKWANDHWSRRGRFWSALIPIVLLALTSIQTLRLHPYYYVYFNPLVGGLKGANQRFETDYWCLSFREAGGLLTQDVSASVPLVVSVGGPRLPLEAFVPASWTLVGSDEPADIYIATTRLNLHRARPGQVVKVVERRGVPLCVVILPNAQQQSGQEDLVPGEEHPEAAASHAR